MGGSKKGIANINISRRSSSSSNTIIAPFSSGKKKKGRSKKASKALKKKNTSPGSSFSAPSPQNTFPPPFSVLRSTVKVKRGQEEKKQRQDPGPLAAQLQPTGGGKQPSAVPPPSPLLPWPNSGAWWLVPRSGLGWIGCRPWAPSSPSTVPVPSVPCRPSGVSPKGQNLHPTTRHLSPPPVLTTHALFLVTGFSRLFFAAAPGSSALGRNVCQQACFQGTVASCFFFFPLSPAVARFAVSHARALSPCAFSRRQRGGGEEAQPGEGGKGREDVRLATDHGIIR